MWQNFQGAVQVERAHQDPRGGSDFPVRLLWQRLEEQAKSESSHVYTWPEERMQQLRKILLDPEYTSNTPER